MMDLDQARREVDAAYSRYLDARDAYDDHPCEVRDQDVNHTYGLYRNAVDRLKKLRLEHQGGRWKASA